MGACEPIDSPSAVSTLPIMYYVTIPHVAHVSTSDLSLSCEIDSNLFLAGQSHSKKMLAPPTPPSRRKRRRPPCSRQAPPGRWLIALASLPAPASGWTVPGKAAALPSPLPRPGARGAARSSSTCLRGFPDWEDLEERGKELLFAREDGGDGDGDGDGALSRESNGHRHRRRKQHRRRHHRHRQPSDDAGRFHNVSKSSSARLSLDHGVEAPHFNSTMSVLHSRPPSRYPSPSPPPPPAKSYMKEMEMNVLNLLRIPDGKGGANGKTEARTKGDGDWTEADGDRPPSPLPSPPPPPSWFDTRPPVALPVGSNPAAPLTLSDLESVLSKNGYLRRSDLSSESGNRDELGEMIREVAATPRDRNGKKGKSKSQKPSATAGSDGKAGENDVGGSVAFPQSSVLTNRAVGKGATLLSSLLGLALASSVARHLWLLGLAAGAFYGLGISKDVDDPDTSPVAQLIISYGRILAKKVLQYYDFVQGVFFMYKTGQLSYDYWKRYENLDQRFQIQDKMDAWNARFVDGKRSFDQWEKENEVGRKILAGMRTLWMVEEQSYQRQLRKKGNERSRYRLLALTQNVLAGLRIGANKAWSIVAGKRRGEIGEFFSGLKAQLLEMSAETVVQRAGSAVTLLVLTSAVGALFASAPGVLSFLAFASGILWPDWVNEAYYRMINIIEETKARGRGEGQKAATAADSARSSPNNSRKGTRDAGPKYHYFVREDGSKRWYRTAQSPCRRIKERPEATPKQGPLERFLSWRPFQGKDEKMAREGEGSWLGWPSVGNPSRR